MMLEEHVEHFWQGNRAVADRAGVEANANPACFFAEGGKLVAAKILMIFDREASSLVISARAASGDRGAHCSNELGLLVAERVPVAAEHRRQAVANDPVVEKSG